MVTNRVPPTPYTLPLRKDESMDSSEHIKKIKECGIIVWVYCQSLHVIT
jgi:hypothetical protein